MYQMHLTTCRLCGCVNEIRNLSGRQASKTSLSKRFRRRWIRNLSGRQASKTYWQRAESVSSFETSQADRHRKLFNQKSDGFAHSKPLRPTGIENLWRYAVNADRIRNLSGRQASKTRARIERETEKFETSQADRHRKQVPALRFHPRNSKPLRPTGIENCISSEFTNIFIRNLSGRQASKTDSR